MALKNGSDAMPGINAIVIGLPAAKADRVNHTGNDPMTPSATAPFRKPRRSTNVLGDRKSFATIFSLLPK
jgi:hypothetical protein